MITYKNAVDIYGNLPVELGNYIDEIIEKDLKYHKEKAKEIICHQINEYTVIYFKAIARNISPCEVDLDPNGYNYYYDHCSNTYDPNDLCDLCLEYYSWADKIFVRFDN